MDSITLKNKFTKYLTLPILLLSFIPLHSIAQPKNSFSLIGSISSINGHYIYFSYQGFSKDRIWDSVIVQQNKFKFSGKLSGQAKCYITTRKSKRDNTDYINVAEPFYIQSGIITISLDGTDFKKCRITGSGVQAQLDVLNRKRKPIYDKLKNLRNRMDSLSILYKPEEDLTGALKIKKQQDDLNNKMDSYSAEIVLLNKKFINTHPESLAATDLLRTERDQYSIYDLQIVFNKMPETHRNSPWGKNIDGYIKSIIKAVKGINATEFSARQFHGDYLKLSDYKGKYVLLDFWASWCLPCRADNPELITLYNKYKEFGIEFIGIALDNDQPDKWKAAIEKDSIGIWHHIIGDEKNNDISTLYGIGSIPTKILIDREGKIIERFGGGGVSEKLLGKTLSEIFLK